MFLGNAVIAVAKLALGPVTGGVLNALESRVLSNGEDLINVDTVGWTMVATILSELSNCLGIDLTEAVVLVKVLFLVLLKFKEPSRIFFSRMSCIAKKIKERSKLLLNVLHLISSEHFCVNIGPTSGALKFVGSSSFGSHVRYFLESARTVSALKRVDIEKELHNTLKLFS